MKIAIRGLLGAAFACALIPQLACQARPEPADLVVTNGKIVTVDDAKPEARAVAVRADRIIEVGSVDAIQRYVGTNTQIVDAARPARHPRAHREPRPLHWRRRVAARAQAGDGADVG